VDTLLSPEGGLIGVLVASFLAATLVPFSSEAVLFGYLKLHPAQVVPAVILATLGNTAGGMTTYLLGRLVPRREVPHLALVKRWGAPALLFAWLPLAGDAFCVAAGWQRVNWLAALVFMAAGRLARYLVVAALAPS
jgi:membrane protein YqaA with SNARE-associated domain